jgi:putative flippase GtrA
MNAPTELSARENGRDETEAERLDRNLLELLQELRVAGIGVQVLFAFLLTLPFTNVFGTLDHKRQYLYVGVLLTTALAAALLTAPVAYHRLVFRQHKKKSLLKAANLLALLGLATVGVAITGSVLLAVDVAVDGPIVPAVAAGTALTFVCLWGLLPLTSHADSY